MFLSPITPHQKKKLENNKHSFKKKLKLQPA